MAKAGEDGEEEALAGSWRDWPAQSVSGPHADIFTVDSHGAAERK
jgi:hypothetical protein